MADVKPARPYRAGRRREQAAATRMAILDAARGLFVERGYTRATIEGIAAAADVAAITVYSAFGSKRALLERLIEVSLAGDEDPRPFLEREGPQAVLREPDQRRQLALFASGIADIMERISPIFTVVRDAAATDPELAARYDGMVRGRLGGMRFLVDALRRNGPLRRGLSVDAAVATVWTVSSPDVHALLTVRLAWSKRRYAAWLRDTLAAALLPS